jgi:hypothetical protein
MRTTRITLSALLLAGTFSIAAAAQPPAPALMQPALNAAIAVGVGVGVHGPVGVDFFYSNLAPYGYWVNRPSYGWAFVPRHVRHGWRPYSAGRWAYTDYGWTWVSAEPFGWATYHYGRWAVDPDYGWEWVPGTDWGPAWVSWQEGDGYCGWAPLSPDVGWSVGAGFGGFDLAVGINPGWYNFVPERSFLAVNVGRFAVPTFRNAAIFRNTTNITNFRSVGGRVFNGSMSVQRAAQLTGQPVRQLRLANASDPRVARVSGNSVAMFRPASVVRQANTPDPTRVAPRSVATGRVAQQLVAQRRTAAAQFNTRGNQGQALRSANAGTRAAPSSAGGRHAAGMTAGSRTQLQAQARHQAAPMGRQSRQALGRNGHGQVTPPPQRTRGGTPPRAGARARQVHQYVPPSQHAGRTSSSSAQRRQSQQALGRNGRGQMTPPPQRTRGGTPPRAGARAQQVHQYVPPPQHQQSQLRRQSAPSPQFQRRSAPAPQRQAQFSRPAPPPQRQQQVMRPSAPPQRPAQFQRQGPPPQMQRQAGPPMRQAPQARPAPAPRQQQQRRQGPPPPAGGV